METTLLYFCIVHLMTYMASSSPVYQPKSATDIDSTFKFCKEITLETFLTDKWQFFTDDQFDMRTGTNQPALSGLLMSDSVLMRNLLEKESVDNTLDNSVQADDINKAFRVALEKCLHEYMSQNAETNPISDDVNRYSQLNSDGKLVNPDLEAYLNSESFGNTAKRTHSLTLNPTGWRKRRSDPYGDERLQRFMRNMHELLEKRQRLQFNPTGW